MRTLRLSIFVVAVGALGLATSAVAQTKYGLGRKATDQEIAGWNIDVDREGKALPPGHGTVDQGRELFQNRCAACHGEKGRAVSEIGLSAERERWQRRSRSKRLEASGLMRRRCLIISAARCR